MFFPSVLILLQLFGLAWLIWYTYYKNRFHVPPGDTARLVLKNVLTGELKVLGQGTYSKMPWWETFEEVNLRRQNQPLLTVDAKSKDNKRFKVEVGYDIIEGRRFDPNTGIPKGLIPQKGTFDQPFQRSNGELDDAFVLLTVQTTNAVERAGIVRREVEDAVEDAIGEYTTDDLMHPSRRKPYVPTEPEHEDLADPNTIVILGPQQVKSSNQFYQRLSLVVLHRANYELRNVGSCIFGIKVINIRPEDTALQEASEAEARARYLKGAAAKLTKPTKAMEGFSSRESMAAVLKQPLGDVAKAEAAEQGAKAIADGLKSIGEGLRNFGKGT